MRRNLETSIVLALAAAGACVATASWATALGNPVMYTLTAKVPPPYSLDFNFATGASGWPPLADVHNMRQDDQDSTGAIAVNQIFNAPATPHNQGGAIATDSGTFFSYAEMLNPNSYLNHIGVFSFTQWAQSFRKDSATATFRFTITGASVYAMCFSTGSRAEFAYDVSGLSGSTEFYHFHQHGGVMLIGNPPFPPAVVVETDGPLSYTESNPDGIQRDRQLIFGALVVDVDLSSIAEGDEFTIVMNEKTQANMKYDEVVRAKAYFRDPAGSGSGVTIETHGLTPTDQPQVPTADAHIPSPVGARFTGAWPNPSRDAFHFTLELPDAAEIIVDVYDLAGRRVAPLARGAFGAGVHTLAWNPRASQAPAGVYFVRASGPGFDAVRRVVRVDGH